MILCVAAEQGWVVGGGSAEASAHYLAKGLVDETRSSGLTWMARCGSPGQDGDVAERFV